MAIVLTGYRGCGKTTVGRLLAADLSTTFTDTDAAVEAAAGQSIADLWRTQGEAAFRTLEAATVGQVLGAAGPRDVIALGGGAVLSEATRALLTGHTVVWLRATAAELARRIAADPTPRPALTPAGTVAEVADVLARREPIYRAVAKFTLDVDSLPPPAVTAAIRKLLAA